MGVGKQILTVVMGLWLVMSVSVGGVIAFIAKKILPRKQGAEVAAKMQQMFLSVFVWAYERNSNLEIRISGDDIPNESSALVLPNHLNHDWAPLYSLALRKSMLGNVRGILKEVSMYIPGFGFGMWTMGWLFLRRNWITDKEYLKEKLNAFKEDGVPVHLWCFPEGTRLTSAKKKESDDFSAQRNLKPLNHCMVPRTKGFVALAQGLKGVVQDVYDVCIAYEGWPTGRKFKGPGAVEIFFPPSNKVVMHVHVRRIPLSSLPEESDDLSKWCYDMFYEKDKILEHYAQNKVFPGANTARKLRNEDWLPGLLFYGATNAAILLVLATLAFR